MRAPSVSRAKHTHQVPTLLALVAAVTLGAGAPGGGAWCRIPRELRAFGCWVRALVMPKTQLVKTDQATTGVFPVMRVILR